MNLFFWGFFIIVLALYSLVYKKNKLRTVFLLSMSLFFYFKTSGVFVLLLLFTICSDYYWGKKIHKSKNDSKRKLFVAFSVLLNLTLLCYFKYAYFFTQSYNQVTGSDVTFFNHFAHFSNTFFSTGFSVDKLLIPIGVSFFTFQSLSYTIDLYRRRIQPVKSIFDYGFFVCFFPHLVAGPIVKAHDFIDQIYQPYKLSRTEFGMALFWILNGFCKKVLADYMGLNFVDRIFENPGLYSGVESILGLFTYSLQIYMDFSGYTDMAIGIALLLGFRLKPNFNSPYKAASTSEFWKRWHISLSSWLQEYLYFPLGGNRKGTIGSYIALSVIVLFLVLLSGKLWLMFVFIALAAVMVLFSLVFKHFRQAINTNINLMVTMLLGGLWHGSSWMFMIWGGLNGLGLVVHKLWAKVSPFKNNETWPVKVFMVGITLSFITFTRLFFRSKDMQTVSAIFERIQNQMGLDLFSKILSGYSNVFIVVGLGYAIHWIPESMKVNYRNWFATRSYPVMGLIVVLLVFLIYQVMTDMQPFIYFQF